MTYINPRWVSEGMKVYVPARLVVASAPATSGLRCTVVNACGEQARVVSDFARYPLDRWVSLSELLVPQEPHP